MLREPIGAKLLSRARLQGLCQGLRYLPEIVPMPMTQWEIIDKPWNMILRMVGMTGKPCHVGLPEPQDF